VPVRNCRPLRSSGDETRNKRLGPSGIRRGAGFTGLPSRRTIRPVPLIAVSRKVLSTSLLRRNIFSCGNTPAGKNIHGKSAPCQSSFHSKTPQTLRTFLAAQPMSIGEHRKKKKKTYRLGAAGSFRTKRAVYSLLGHVTKHMVFRF